VSSSLPSLTARLREARGDRFPEEGVRLLHEAALLDAEAVADLVTPQDGAPRMFGVLVAVGRGDLALGRLYEGHVNAMGLLSRLGDEGQRARGAALAAEGRLLGVWGADDFRSPGRLEAGTLKGRKTYCSGAARLGAALIAVEDEEDRKRLVLLDTERLEGRWDPSWWQPMGMEATESWALEIEGLEVPAADLVGPPDAYLEQPFFGGGAVRFVAVQLGGVLAVWDAGREHLARTGRHRDPHQAARLGEMLAACEGAHAGVRRAYERLGPALAWEPGGGEAADALIADAARTLTAEAGERVMALATRSVGCAGLMSGHPLERALRDLSVYLRQPAPDAALTRAGEAAARGAYRPAFDAD
jgi:alkylation response protein AidB-like acyl-CoA dehydrogenase